jgi:hypothetical protein
VDDVRGPTLPVSGLWAVLASTISAARVEIGFGCMLLVAFCRVGIRR